MKPEHTLELIDNATVLFSSTGKWLHPLFDLELFLQTHRIDLQHAEIHDKIVGRASAFLIVRMGIRTVHAGILSSLGKDVLDRAGASVTWETLIDAVQCRTEGMLRDVTDPEEAYRSISDLARKAG